MLRREHEEDGAVDAAKTVCCGESLKRTGQSEEQARIREGDMKERKKRNYGWMFNSVILAGIIIFAIGLYYSMARAGIPVQDPTEEMQLEYVINMGIGETLIRNGLMLTLFGVMLRLLYGMITQRRKDRGAGISAAGMSTGGSGDGGAEKGTQKK